MRTRSKVSCTNKRLIFNRFMGLWKTVFLAFVVCLTFTQSYAADQSFPQTLKVGVYTSPPFIQKEGTRYSGMAIDIWEHAAGNLGWKYTYQEFPNYAELVNAVADGTVNVAVADLTVTEDRARRLDFTYPWYDAGLRIMINSHASSDFMEVIEDLSQAGHLENYLMLFGLILVATAIVTLFDRRFDPDFPKRWRDGTAESFYQVMSMATSGKSSHKNLFGWIGRIWQALWMAVGVAIIAYVTSSIASVMTASHIENSINSLTDLQGKTVGVRAGSATQEYLQKARFDVKAFDHIEDASSALANGDVAALVGDAPVMEYYVHNNPKMPFEVVGNIFRPDKYAFGVTYGSQLANPLSLQIIRLHESGQLEEFKQKYFGFTR